MAKKALHTLLVILAVLFLFTGCGDDLTSAGSSFIVVATTPASGSSVSINTVRISFQFSGNVEIGSFILVDSRGFSISGTYTVSGDTATFTASKRLDYGTSYTATAVNAREFGKASGRDFTLKFSTSLTSIIFHTTPDSHNADVGKFNSIDVSTADKRAYMSYYNQTEGSIYAISTTNGTDWLRVVGTASDHSFGKGKYSVLKLDSNNKIHLAIYDPASGLRYLNNVLGSWATVYVDSTVFMDPVVTITSRSADGLQADYALPKGSHVINGSHMDMFIDKDDKAHIAYHDERTTSLKYATNKPSAWTTSIVDPGLSSDNPGQYPAIFVEPDGTVHITSHDYHMYNQNGNLKYAVKPPSTNTWSLYTLDSTGDVGLYPAIGVFNSKVYIAYYHRTHSAVKLITNETGSWISSSIASVATETAISLFIDRYGLLHASYFDDAILYYGSYNASWLLKPVDSSGVGHGIYTSITIDPDAKVRISYYDKTDGDLKYAHQL